MGICVVGSEVDEMPQNVYPPTRRIGELRSHSPEASESLGYPKDIDFNSKHSDSDNKNKHNNNLNKNNNIDADGGNGDGDDDDDDIDIITTNIEQSDDINNDDDDDGPIQQRISLHPIPSESHPKTNNKMPKYYLQNSVETVDSQNSSDADDPSIEIVLRSNESDTVETKHDDDDDDDDDGGDDDDSKSSSEMQTDNDGDDAPIPDDDGDDAKDKATTKEGDYIVDISDLSSLESNCKYKFIESASHTLSGVSNGKVKTNQDDLIRIDSFGPSSLFQLYGVCDGHGPDGHYCSQYITKHLPTILSNLLKSSMNDASQNGMNISQILRKSFLILEAQLYSDRDASVIEFDCYYSGTTATIGLYFGDRVYIANIGDSRTVLGKVAPLSAKKRAVPCALALTNDHSPSNRKEMFRIEKSKSGRIIMEDDDARIQIDIPDFGNGKKNLLSVHPGKGHARNTSLSVRKISASVSRSIGDKYAHEYGGLISEPEITIHEMSDDDIFIIWASDGIWQMNDNNDVMRAIGTKLNANKNERSFEHFEKITHKLVKESQIMWQDEYEDYIDDITCVVARIGKIK